MMTIEIHMGQKMTARLAELNLSQSDLARMIGRSRQSVSALAASDTWHSKTVHLVAKALRVPVQYFFEQ